MHFLILQCIKLQNFDDADYAGIDNIVDYLTEKEGPNVQDAQYEEVEFLEPERSSDDTIEISKRTRENASAHNKKTNS